MKVIASILFLIYSSNIWALEKTSSVYGYVRNGDFHPLLAVERNSIKNLTNSYVEIPKIIEPMFQGATGKTVIIESEEKYNDVLRGDQIGSLGNLIKTERPDYFFYKSADGKSIDILDMAEDALSFYAFFSKDNWGKHFVSPEQLNELIADIATQTNVIIHAVTDIDSDKKNEVWVSYQLMYGEVGAMVYEKDADGEWVSLINHCYSCD